MMLSRTAMSCLLLSIFVLALGGQAEEFVVERASTCAQGGGAECSDEGLELRQMRGEQIQEASLIAAETDADTELLDILKEKALETNDWGFWNKAKAAAARVKKALSDLLNRNKKKDEQVAKDLAAAEAAKTKAAKLAAEKKAEKAADAARKLALKVEAEEKKRKDVEAAAIAAHIAATAKAEEDAIKAAEEEKKTRAAAAALKKAEEEAAEAEAFAAQEQLEREIAAADEAKRMADKLAAEKKAAAEAAEVRAAALKAEAEAKAQKEREAAAEAARLAAQAKAEAAALRAAEHAKKAAAAAAALKKAEEEAAEAEAMQCTDTHGSIRDKYNNNCVAYDGHPHMCGKYDANGFNSKSMCCECGGGSTGGSCQDTHGSIRDKYNNNCDAYNGHPHMCGKYDANGFNSKSMCCQCGGGSAR